MKKTLFLMMAILLLTGCEKDKKIIEKEEEEIQNIELTEMKTSFKVGESFTYTVNHYPSHLPSPNYNWETSNPQVAKVDNGTVTAISQGVAKITVYFEGINTYITINVHNIEPESLTLSQDTISLFIGDKLTLNATIYPDNAITEEIIWTSTDPLVAKVDNQGNVEAIEEGETQIIAQTKNIKDTCVVKVDTKEISKELVLPNAGTLKEVLGEQKDIITNLTIKGEINAIDLITLKQMKKLSTLDMQDAHIIEYLAGETVYHKNELLDENFSWTKLKVVILPKDITQIPKSAFAWCGSLKHVKMPNSVTVIEDEAFVGCYQLKKIELPSELKKIGEGAFITGIEGELNIPEEVEFIGRNAFQGTNITRVRMPKNLKNIEIQLFDSCTKLEEAVLSEGVEIIKANAFRKCSNLKSINIPSTVKIIDWGVFDECKSLVEIHSKSIQPPYVEKASTFSEVNKEMCKVFIPIGTKNAYQLALQWSDFTVFIEE